MTENRKKKHIEVVYKFLAALLMNSVILGSYSPLWYQVPYVYNIFLLMMMMILSGWVLLFVSPLNFGD